MNVLPRVVLKRFFVVLFSAWIAAAPMQARAQSEPGLTQQELDQMLAPIALYPDSLLSQILMASTYPLEVVQAARWSKANPHLTGEAAVRAVAHQDWDPSVKSLVAFPQLLAMMDEKLEWTERLGEAFLAQEPQVMDTVQALRQRAYAAGNLRTTEHMTVSRQGEIIVVEPASPHVVYVPYYDPWVVYGPWWWPAHPPVYWRFWVGYHVRPGISLGFFWGPAVRVSGGFFFGGFDWPRRSVHVVNVSNYYYSMNVTRQRNISDRHRNVTADPHSRFVAWKHDPAHRRGAPYRSEVARQRWVQSDAANVEPRREKRAEERAAASSRGALAVQPDVAHGSVYPLIRGSEGIRDSGRAVPPSIQRGPDKLRGTRGNDGLSDTHDRPGVHRDMKGGDAGARTDAPRTGEARPELRGKPAVAEARSAGSQVERPARPSKRLGDGAREHPADSAAGGWRAAHGRNHDRSAAANPAENNSGPQQSRGAHQRRGKDERR